MVLRIGAEKLKRFSSLGNLFFCARLFQCGINVHLISSVKAAHTAWVQLCSAQRVPSKKKKKKKYKSQLSLGKLWSMGTHLSVCFVITPSFLFVSCPEAYCFSIHCNFQYRLRHTHTLLHRLECESQEMRGSWVFFGMSVPVVDIRTVHT